MQFKSLMDQLNLFLPDVHLNQYDKALEDLYEAEKLNPDDAEIYEKLGRTNFCMLKFEKAIEYYKKAVKSGLGSAYVYNNLALAYSNLGERERESN